MAENKENVKQAAISSKDLSRGVRIRIEGLSGSFQDAHFGDDGVSTGPVSPSTQKALRDFFGDTVVKEVRPARQEKAPGGKKAEGEADPNADGEGGGESNPTE